MMHRFSFFVMGVVEIISYWIIKEPPLLYMGFAFIWTAIIDATHERFIKEIKGGLEDETE